MADDPAAAARAGGATAARGDRPPRRGRPAARVRIRPGPSCARSSRRPLRCSRPRPPRSPSTTPPATGSSSRSRPASRARASSASRSAPTRASPGTSTRPARRSPCRTSRRDPRFGRSVAERTAYVPRSIVAVPLVDDQGTIGVLEVLDKRSQAAFSPPRHRARRGVRPAGRRGDPGQPGRARPRGSLLAGHAPATRRASTGPVSDAAVDELVEAGTARLGRDDDSRLWELVEQVARIRGSDPDRLELVADLLGALARQADRDSRARRRRPPGTRPPAPPTVDRSVPARLERALRR